MWENADIQITGDDELNRAVRFNIFHLMSTGNEHDDHVNVGAKLLTGSIRLNGPVRTLLCTIIC